MNDSNWPRILLLMTLGLAPPGYAHDEHQPEERGISLSGFGTLGLVHNSTGRAEYRRDLLQPGGPRNDWSANTDSRLGAQINARFGHGVEVVLQGISRYSHDDDHDPQLTWGFVSYTPDPEWNFRVGRLGWDVYLMADSRDIGYSYTWIRPPVDYFGKLLLSHFDGADVVYRRPAWGGLATFKVYGGRIDQDVPTGGGMELDLTGSTIAGGNLSYRIEDWLLRVSYAASMVEDNIGNFEPLQAALRGTGLPAAVEIADEFNLENRTIHVVSAGGAWEHGPWQAQLMYNRITSASLALASTNSAYFFLGYRRGKWNPFFSASGTLTHSRDRTTGLPMPNPLDTALGMTLDGGKSIQHTLSAGLRYDIMDNVDIKVQVDRVHVYGNGAGLWAGAQPGWDGDATLFSIALDFVF